MARPDHTAAALKLAAAGMFIFPCNADKTPKVRWQAASSTDPDQVRRWFTNLPPPLIAIDCGKSNLVVVDLDRHSGGPDGVAHYRVIADRNGGHLPDTPVVKTARNGYHLYYRQTADERIRNSTCAEKGIDVRGVGGYVIASGSSLSDGRCWSQEPGTPDLAWAFSTGRVPILPGWLRIEIGIRSTWRGSGDPFAAQTASQAPTVATDHEREHARMILAETCQRLALALPGSHRNAVLNRGSFFAGQMVAAGWLAQSDAIRALYEACKLNGYLGKDGHKAVISTIKSGLTAGQKEPRMPLVNLSLPSHATEGRTSAGVSLSGEPPRPLRRELPPQQPFPTDALGQTLAAAVYSIVDRVQCAESVAAMSVLGASSLLAQAQADVVIPGTGHNKPISLFLLTVAPTGERKTTADVEALRPVREYEKALRDAYEAALPAYQNRLEAWQTQRETIKKAGKDAATKASALDALGPAPQAPLYPLLTCPEPTLEGLSKLYVHGHAALGIFSDEGGQFIGGHGMSKENQLRTITGASSLWDGTPLTRVRALDGASVLPGRRLAVHLMAQPDVAAALLSDPALKDQGFLSRLLVAAPAPKAGTRFQRPPHPESHAAMAAYNHRLSTLARLPLPLAAGKSNELMPRPLRFTNEAAQIWREFADHVEKQIARDGRLNPIVGFANKLSEHAARIVGVLNIVEDPYAAVIELDILLRAIRIAEFFSSEALRLFDASGISNDVRIAESLLDWLHNTWTEPYIGLKAIYQRGPNSIRTAAVAKRAVAILQDHGWLVAAPLGTAVGGHTVREAWTVVPAPPAATLLPRYPSPSPRVA